MKLFLLSLFLSIPAIGFAADLSVVSVDGLQAHAVGDVQGLHAGDLLYFSRSPFKFPVKEIKGKEVIVNIPAQYELKVGSTLFRQPNDSIRKNMQTEEKLKHAIED